MRVGAIVDDHGRSGRLALQHGAGIEFHFLRGKAGAGGDAGIDLNSVAGPLMVFSIPSSTSTTPGIFLIASATCGAQACSSSGSWRTA